MSLIKCNECKKEVSTKAKTCQHCGSPVPKFCPECENEIVNKKTCSNCGYTLPKSSKTIRIILSTFFILIGSVLIINGNNLEYHGTYTLEVKYGGDAYTGIQNASATTGNNINELGEMLCASMKTIMIIMGCALDGCGVLIASKKED